MDAKIIEEVQTRYILHWNYRYSNLRSKKYQVNSYLLIVKNQIIVMKYTKIIKNSNVDLHFLVDIPSGPSMMEQRETNWKPDWWVFIKNTKSLIFPALNCLFYTLMMYIGLEILLIWFFSWKLTRTFPWQVSSLLLVGLWLLHHWWIMVCWMFWWKI